jgi:hypothetical protein
LANTTPHFQSRYLKANKWEALIKTLIEKGIKAMNDKNIEIYFDDLTPEKQKEIYDRLGDNGNYDVFPIVIVPERAEK